MIKVGITGGIGTGKSTVCKLFASLGVPIYDADTEAKKIMNTHPLVHQKLVEQFGNEAFLEGNLNRPFIAKQVFNDEANLQFINQLVHPLVGEDFEQWTKKQAELGAKMVLKEAALLIESNSHKTLDYLILVTSPLELRIDRIKKRDTQRTESEIRAIIDKQLTDSEKKKFADFVILNDEQNLLIPQVLSIFKDLIYKT